MMDCCNEGHCEKCADGKCDMKACGCHRGMPLMGAKAKLVLRVALGLILVLHGYGKLWGGQPGMEMFTGMVAGLGFPMPTVFAYAAALSEFFGGLMIMFGLCTRFAAACVSVVMLVAFGMVKKFKLPMGDADLMLLATAVSLILSGPGKLSLDAKYCKGGTWMRKGESK